MLGLCVCVRVFNRCFLVLCCLLPFFRCSVFPLWFPCGPHLLTSRSLAFSLLPVFFHSFPSPVPASLHLHLTPSLVVFVFKRVLHSVSVGSILCYSSVWVSHLVTPLCPFQCFPASPRDMFSPFSFRHLHVEFPDLYFAFCCTLFEFGGLTLLGCFLDCMPLWVFGFCSSFCLHPCAFLHLGPTYNCLPVVIIGMKKHWDH